jgi:hypothetical protein
MLARPMPSALAISVSPEISKPIGRQLSVTHRMLNISVPEPRLQRPRIMPLVGKLVTATMAQHVGMDREWHAGSLADALDEGMEALGRHRRTALGHEHVRAGRLFSLKAAQSPQLIALEGMDARCAALAPTGSKSSTADRLAAQQVGSYRGNTGRDAQEVATAAPDPRPTFDHALSCK